MKGQKDLSQFFNIKKQEESTISINIPENIGLKKNIEKTLVKDEKKCKNLNAYFK